MVKRTLMAPDAREKSSANADSHPPLVAERLAATYDEPGAFELAGVDLTVHEGELVAVLGANGAGKSTLLRVLSGTLAPQSGDVRLFGSPIRTYDQRDVARVLAIVGQSEDVAFGFTVREVVAMGRAPHQGGWMRATEEDEAVVREVLARCDLERLADRPVGSLSGGEQKRVGIARALAQRPRVLLLDEPSAFLDVRHQIELYDLLVEEVSRERLACLVVMHDLNVAAQYATKVALMKAGRLLAVGPVESVMTYQKLRDTFDADLYVGENDVNGSRFFLPMRTKPAPRPPREGSSSGASTSSRPPRSGGC